MGYEPLQQSDESEHGERFRQYLCVSYDGTLLLEFLIILRVDTLLI
ncbi:MAG: hypothetical protein J07HQW1_02411 [Haloquadratum walsbyi J07HQW1]|uniref:Uncharacterized protein n=1 Tax=Haloquadratum walsbyi J07HQW1 TaxID=1238424 RepID=U1MQR4_9EURY|nr:MAG: hypothetical protein J07HQW1_02411 [Haloquadratum walsbyi J07HQW1]